MPQAGKIEDDMLLYNLDGDSFRDKISLDEIKILEEKVGTHLFTGFYYGFIPMFIFPLIETGAKNGNSSINSDIVPSVFVAALVTGGTGALIGYFIDDWEEIDLTEYKSKDVSYNFSPIYLQSSQSVGINFSLSF